MHYTGRVWAGGTFLRQQKKVPPAHAKWVYLEEPIRLPSPPPVNFSIHPCVCLSYGITLIFNVEIIIMVSTWSHLSVFCPLQIPFLYAKWKFGFNKNIQRNLLIDFVYCTGRALAGGNFLRQRKQSSSSSRTASVRTSWRSNSFPPKSLFLAAGSDVKNVWDPHNNNQ